MTLDEINDEDSIRAWLEGHADEVAATLAHRAAMRVAPRVWGLRAHRALNRATSLGIHCVIIAAVAGHGRMADVARAATAAAAAANGGVNAATFFWAAETVSPDAGAPIGAAAAYSAADAALRAGAAIAPEMWLQVRKDAKTLEGAKTGQPADAAPLWHDGENPLADDWQKVRTAWAGTGDPGWQFWIDWYEAALAGRPLLGDWDRHWNLLTDIALIDADKWDTGPDKVNPLIAGIWKSHQKIAAVLDATPNGEDLLLTVEDGKIAAVPRADIGDDLRSHILRSVEKALERFFAATSQTGNSNFGPVLRDCAAQDLAYLREDVEENKAYDVGLHDAIDECLGALRRKFAEQGLSDDPAALRLTTVLERCTVDIYANSEAAREVLETRADELYRRISLEHSLQLNQLVHDMAADSVAPLARALLADLQRADDEAADPDLRRRSRYRTISRLPRGARAVRYSRFEDGKRVMEDRPQPSNDRLWVATVLGPPGAVLLQHLLSL